MPSCFISTFPGYIKRAHVKQLNGTGMGGMGQGLKAAHVRSDIKLRMTSHVRCPSVPHQRRRVRE